MLYYTHLFTCIGTQLFKGCVEHLLQNFMPARVFVVSIILKIKKHTHYRVITCYFPNTSDENICWRFDSTNRNTETSQKCTRGNIVCICRYLYNA